LSLTVLAGAALISGTAVPMVDVAAQTLQPQSASEPAITPAAPPPASAAPVTLPVPEFAPETAGPPQAAAQVDEGSQSADEGIVVSGERNPPQDPMQSVNQASYDAVQAVDGAVIAPIAMQYKKALPRPVRTGLRNFLVNLTEPVVALNFLLQMKPGKAAETLGRFAINSTIGVAGVIDVARAKPFRLPYRRNGFAYTFGYHGIGNGPYMFLPLVGATTLRDVIGLGLDRFLMPFAVGGPLLHPAYVYGGFVVRSLDDRVENDELFRQIEQESNPYASYREFYLKTRQAEIDALKGKVDLRQEGAFNAPEAVPAAPVAAQAPVAPVIVFISQPVIQPLPAGYKLPR
jgi:phospholipid-binding lipoprotein MlaA